MHLGPRVWPVANWAQSAHNSLKVLVAILLVALESLHKDPEHGQAVLVARRLLEGAKLRAIPVHEMNLFVIVIVVLH